MRGLRHRRMGVLLQIALLAAGGVLAASAAGAQGQNYDILTAVWGHSAGRDADIPFVGQTVDNCENLVIGIGPHTMAPATTPDVTTTQVGQPFGCPSLDPSIATMLATDGNVTATSGLGGGFVIPPFFIERDLPGMNIAISFPNNTRLVQAATSARWRVPHSVRAEGVDAIGIDKMLNAGNPMQLGPLRRMPASCTEGGPGGPGTGPGNPPDCTNLAEFGRFHRSAWMGGPASTTPGQTGRVGVTFTFCPDPMNFMTPPAPGNPFPCTALNQGNPNQILVKYSGGERGFGGTINQVVTAEGSPDGSLAVVTALGNAAFFPLDSSIQSIQQAAVGYADFGTNLVSAASIIGTGYMTGSVMVQGPAGGPFTTVFIITQIMGTTSVMGQPPPIPTLFGQDATQYQYNFPLTTADVVARAMNAIGTPFITLTGMGYDTFTASGARNIQLVAANISHLTVPPSNAPGIQTMFLSLPEPGQGGGLLAGAAMLLGLAVWRARPLTQRPRRAT